MIHDSLSLRRVSAGPWHIGTTEDDRVFIQSEDFTHDARLYVTGDFACRDQSIAYAEDIAKRLNHVPDAGNMVKPSGVFARGNAHLESASRREAVKISAVVVSI